MTLCCVCSLRNRKLYYYFRQQVIELLRQYFYIYNSFLLPIDHASLLSIFLKDSVQCGAFPCIVDFISQHLEPFVKPTKLLQIKYIFRTNQNISVSGKKFSVLVHRKTEENGWWQVVSCTEAFCSFLSYLSFSPFSTWLADCKSSMFLNSELFYIYMHVWNSVHPFLSLHHSNQEFHLQNQEFCKWPCSEAYRFIAETKLSPQTV